MNDRYSNLLNAFTTTLQFANDPERKAVWEDQTPKKFGEKLEEAGVMIGPVADWMAKQSATITGAAVQKAKEEEDLEVIADVQSQALATYLLDQGDIAGAEPFRRKATYWQTLKDQELLARTQDLIVALTPLTTGPGAATIAEDYGISAAGLATLTQERSEYAAIVGAPAAARAGRAGYSALARAKFEPLKVIFADMDRLVGQLRSRPGGEAFVAGWFPARKIVDAGHGPGTGGGGGGGTPPTPTAPTGVPTDIVMMRDSGEHVAASWVLPEGATGVKVFNGAPGGEQTLIGPFEGTSGVFDVAAGTQVWFAATNAVGDGPQDGPHEVP